MRNLGFCAVRENVLPFHSRLTGAAWVAVRDDPRSHDMPREAYYVQRAANLRGVDV